jgi:Fe-S cluster assembly ATP-binding protein
MSKLKVEDLYVSVNGEMILKGVNLEIELGKVHALMGPNGSGKSTLANALMGNPKYKIEKGKIMIDDFDITELKADERAKLGLFLSFQYPSEITGVTMSNFLRTAYNSVNKESLDVVAFHKLLKEKMNSLDIDAGFGRRYLNEGFSGGEKKRAEILQMSILQPKYAILDETDSGLDIDSIKIVGDGVSKMKGEDKGIFIITHYNRILKHITPDVVSILVNGKIVKEGGKDLAEEIEKNGFDEYTKEVINV